MRLKVCGGHRLYFASQEYHDEIINKDPASNRQGRGIMDELTERLAARIGIDSAVAGNTVGMILDFLRKKSPAVGTPGLRQFA